MLSILVVSPYTTVPGGVSVFVDCMKRHIAGSKVDSFYVGSVGASKESPFATLRRLVTAPLELARLVKGKKFDVVHINPSFDAKSLIRDGLLVLALRAVKFNRILFYIHGWDFGVQRRILRYKTLRIAAAWGLNQCALITVLSGAFRDGLAAIGVDPARIVVTTTMFEGAGLKAIETETPASTRRFILFLSRFDPEKGGRELLLAFAALADTYPDLDLVMAGDGADAAYLKAEVGLLNIASRVRFTGYVSGSEKWRLLRDCTLFALPTYYRSEGMPVAVLEAMGAGKPVLTGSAGALRQIVSEPANGVVLENITHKSVEAGLRRLLDDSDFATAAAQRNAQIAWDKFEAHAVTAEIETYYQKVARCS